MNCQRSCYKLFTRFLFASIFLLTACGPAATIQAPATLSPLQPTQTQPTPTDTPTPIPLSAEAQKLVDLIKAYEAAFNKHDTNGAMALLADDIKFSVAGMIDIAENSQDMRSLYESYRMGNAEIHTAGCQVSELSAQTIICNVTYAQVCTRAMGFAAMPGRASFSITDNHINAIQMYLDQDGITPFWSLMGALDTWAQSSHPTEQAMWWAPDVPIADKNRALFNVCQEYASTAAQSTATNTPPPPAATETSQPSTPGPFKPYIISPGISNSDYPTYANPGKYSVGLTSTTIRGGAGKISVYIWYPVQASGAPDKMGAPYPLVIYSPGSGASGIDYSYLLERLASYGFVAITWDPKDVFDYWWREFANRIMDMKQLIAFGDALTAPGGQLASLIDMQHIGIAGHSTGGWQALVGGGAQLDFWCLSHPELIPNSSYCRDGVQGKEKIAEALGLKTVPTGLWPAQNDPRVRAVIAMAPDGDVFGPNDEGVAVMKVPVMIMTGSDDTMNNPQAFAFRIYQTLNTSKKSSVVFDKKDHGFFFGSDMDRVWIQHMMNAYFLAELKGDPEAAKALAPANMSNPGIKYETTEFGAGQ